MRDSEYTNWIEQIKDLVKRTQIKASIIVNQELIKLYWQIGRSFAEASIEKKWGTSVVESLSKELSFSFPNQQGFSRSNLFAMKKFYEFYNDSSISNEIIQQLVGQIPWGQNIVITTKAKSIEEAIFYIRKTLENNWSRAILSHQIELKLYSRHGKATNNFESTLPKPHSELAIETLKDPYKFDFLSMTEKVVEKDIEDQLIKHITSFLLELGTGFSFVGRQVPLKIDGQEFYVDLLFYHIKLKCYIVVELKTGEFKAEYAGKMNLYLSAVDDLIKSENENPTIGLLLCKSKSKVIAEYALRGTTQPIGVAQNEIVKAIPKDLKSSLPSISDIENELTMNL